MQPLPESQPFATEIFTSPWQPTDLVTIDLGVLCLMEMEAQQKVLAAFADQTGFEMRVLYQSRQFALRLDREGLYLETLDKPVRRIRASTFYISEFKTHRDIHAFFENILQDIQRKQDLQVLARGGDTAKIMAHWLSERNYSTAPKKVYPVVPKPSASQSVLDQQRKAICDARREILKGLCDIVFTHDNLSVVAPSCTLKTLDNGCRLCIRATTTNAAVHKQLERTFRTMEDAAKAIVHTGAIRNARCREYYNAVPGSVVQRFTFAASSRAILTAYQNDPAHELVVLAEDFYDSVDAVMAWERQFFGATSARSVQGVYGRTYEFAVTQTIKHRSGEVIWNAHVSTASK